MRHRDLYCYMATNRDSVRLVFSVIVILWKNTAAAWECYECTDARNISECVRITTCQYQQNCFTRVTNSSSTGVLLYNLGCVDRSQCAGDIQPSLVGRSLVTRSADVVYDKCCHGDLCNKEACAKAAFSGFGTVEERCPLTLNDLCGWTQSTDDTFDWTQHAGATGSSGTGPDYDHTNGTADGKYLYIETSSPRIPGDYAILKSPVMEPSHDDTCFSFFYNMYGSSIGSLQVIIEDLCTHKRTQLFSQSGDHGNVWLNASLDIFSLVAPHPYQILIRAEVESSYEGDIAIDDFLFTNHRCKARLLVDKCSFEHGLCKWTQGAVDDFDWLLNSGTTPSTNTGPYNDHTFGNSFGHYLYIETSSPRHPGDHATIVSPMMTANTSVCLTFYYSMYGLDIRSLEIQTEDQVTGVSTTLFEITGDHGSEWRNASVPAFCSHNYNIAIRATVGNGYRGDIAIDDLQIEQGSCQ